MPKVIKKKKKPKQNTGMVHRTPDRKKPKALSRNLNQRMSDESRKTQNVFTRGRKKIHILFDGVGIQRAIIRMINTPETAFVVGCIAWLSNKGILGAMAKKKGGCIVCTKDKLTKGARNQKAYAAIRPAYPGGVIRVVGEGRGWHKSLMHHKFLVGLNAEGKPIWVTNGSFNFTTSAVSNLENLMVMEDEDVAECYFQEFKRVHALSSPLKLKF
jgi:hypothetical protein